MDEAIAGAAGRLLKVVEVEYEQRIRCRAQGCGRPVYKRIHVVDAGGQITVVGSDCFERLYGHGPREEPIYGGSTGDGDENARLLSAEERELMESKTEAFIDLMRGEYAQAVERELVAMEEQLEAQRRHEEAARERMSEWERRQEERRAAEMAAQEESRRREEAKAALERAIEGFDPVRRAVIEQQVRDELGEKYQINVKLPGWVGWYKSLVRERIVQALGKSEVDRPAQVAVSGRVRQAWESAKRLRTQEGDGGDENGPDADQQTLW